MVGPQVGPLRERRRRRWLYALWASLIVHGVVLPVGLPRLLVEKSPEIEVTYLPEPGPEVPSESPQDKEDKEALALKPKLETPPEPERRLPPVPEKKPEEKKPLEVVPMPNLPMVDQEQFPDEADNDKAHFLAQKNHRAAEDVQAKERTLDKPPPADSPTAPTGKPNPPPPESASEQRIAKSVDSPLRMREPGAELSEPRDVAPGGDLQPWVPKRPPQPGATAGVFDHLPIAPSQLGPRDYDRLVGPGLAEAERRSAALADKSAQPGHWDRLMKKQDALRASLENFVGNVRIGNQSELGTRKHPFAAFITAMHRQIHRYWGDGFLADLDKKHKDSYPASLVSAIEIAIAPDGKVDGTIIVKPSGSLPFDTAALDAVVSAAPFSPPPEAIKSRDGKVYLTWYFHRDDRQCHPNYVNMHILTTPPAEKRKPPGQKGPSLAAAPAEADPGRLRLAGSSLGASFANSPAKSGEGMSAPAASAAKPSPAPKSAPSPAVASGVPDSAREATARWLAAYKKADARWLAGASGLPFTAAGKQVADDAQALRAFFAEMLSEGAPPHERVTYYTQAQIRQKLGRLPRGADEDEMVFAMLEGGGEELVLLLSPTDRGYSVVGIDR